MNFLLDLSSGTVSIYITRWLLVKKEQSPILPHSLTEKQKEPPQGTRGSPVCRPWHQLKRKFSGPVHIWTNSDSLRMGPNNLFQNTFHEILLSKVGKQRLMITKKHTALPVNYLIHHLPSSCSTIQLCLKTSWGWPWLIFLACAPFPSMESCFLFYIWHKCLPWLSKSRWFVLSLELCAFLYYLLDVGTFLHFCRSHLVSFVYISWLLIIYILIWISMNSLFQFI